MNMSSLTERIKGLGDVEKTDRQYLVQLLNECVKEIENCDDTLKNSLDEIRQHELNFQIVSQRIAEVKIFCDNLK